jgi:hypothetical protein
MSDIAAVAQSLSASTANARSLLAIKLQHQQEQAVVALVEKVLEATPAPSGSASSGGQLVDIVV